MPTFVFAPGERTFLETLNRLGVRYMLVGMSAAVAQGAPGSTFDLDLWFENPADDRVAAAARAAGAAFVWRMSPPMLAGDGIGERFDVVTSMSGLGPFGDEWRHTREIVLDGVALRVLLLPRIVASKRASGRPKDLATLPMLEATLAALEETERT